MTTQQNIKGKITIRSIEYGDIDTIFDIDKILLGEDRAATMIDLLTEDLAGAQDLSFVAEVDGRVVGFILARHTYIGEPVVEAGLIQGLGVQPLYQKRGIATQLVGALIEYACSQNLKTIRIIISERDSRMEGFFSSMKFNRAQQIVYDKVFITQ
ncbi:MAG: GNAT family N-acetyltransferase [Dehalococcoidales bacterium]|nr:GNAT family N-acetyltransferase [Dehalococcoidales bacterium]